MWILHLLEARRAAATSWASECRDDEGPFFDLDFSSCSVRASSSNSSGSLSLSDSDSDDECTELDFIISLQRSTSASPLKFCASTRANSLPSQRHGARKRVISNLRSPSFGARKTATPLYARSSSRGRRSFARSSTSSARSFRLFADSLPRATEQDENAVQQSRRTPSRDVFRRCLSKISHRIRTAAASPRAAEARGLRRLRKCLSASRRDDDSAVEKQDGLAGAIAHCKESLHRVEHAAFVSECDSPLLRSRSDPGKCEVD